MSGLSALAGRRVDVLRARLLVHTYTRTPVTDGAANDWNETDPLDGAAVTGRPCYFQVRDVARVDEGGRVVVKTPTLLVDTDDTLAAGDKVTAIADAAGAPIDAGPFVVESVEMIDGGGVVGYLRASLRRGDVI